MKKLKVLTVVGTRPEIIRLSRVISVLESSKSINHILVHTGQNYDYELNEIFFKKLEIKKPDYFLNAANDTPSSTTGEILISIDPILENENPDAFLVLGDTNSCLCTIAAKKRQIPIFHMEAGNRCFDERVPEETNRRIVDHISDINLPYSDIARQYLLREGISADRIIKTGSPMYEVLNYYKTKINKSNILNKLNLKKKNYFVVSCHREENVNNKVNFKNLTNCLNIIADKYKCPIIFSTHPRTRKIFKLGEFTINPLVKLVKPLGFFDYNYLQINSKVVLSDSGTISEESSILNFKAINIREAHERPEAMEEAVSMMTGLHPIRINQALNILNFDKELLNMNINKVDDYTKTNVSIKVIKIIISYVDYINKVVWRK